MSEQGNTKEAGLLASWLVYRIHPSEWIELDREDLNEAAGVTFSDEHYGQLMDALHNYQLAQLVRLPPLNLIEKKLDRLAEKPGQASRILTSIKAKRILRGDAPDFFDPSDSNYHRSVHNVNEYVWHLLAAQGAYVPIGSDESISLSPEQIEAARESAQFLAQSERPKGSSTKGLSIRPGLVDFIDEVILVWKNAGGSGPVLYEGENGEWRGFLYSLLMLLLKAADYIMMKLEVFHGGDPSSVSKDERKVGQAELEDYISYVRTPVWVISKSLEGQPKLRQEMLQRREYEYRRLLSRISEKTVLNYYRMTQYFQRQHPA